ncbi:hypothetical protein [Streptomyces marincola]|uniref:Uncharacterized protein n=1 Tax=Streptomyces marincola TaxID=2878388 RepID=A0A1W7D447_9ACTN|nr:hypothetical protein [Streptomyces marincola]ARQ71707.1 hypothetical protein CAG99_25325 [Streptomyces marincola]UCM86837.1 hypothetical protein LC193_02150 [Streptomyces marincola]
MAHITREPTPDTSNRPGPAVQAERAHAAPEGRGCLFALSQPPLMLFLTVIGTLLLIAGVHDLFLL